MDIRILRDLYDMTNYYSGQLQLLDFQSYNGLSNAHKSVHTIATKESSILKDMMSIYHAHPEMVLARIREESTKEKRVIILCVSPSKELQSEENELVSRYQTSLTIEHLDDIQDVKVKLSLEYKDSEDDDEEMIQEKTDLPGLEVVYSVQNIRALVALYFFEKGEEKDKIYQLIAPSITNTVKDNMVKGRGNQDSHLYIPDLHSRILELAAKFDNLSF